MKNFDRLAKLIIKETDVQELNSSGKELLSKYYELIKTIEDTLSPILQSYVTDIEKVKKEIAIQIISTISSQQLGSEKFNIMHRLDILTNGGKTPIDKSQITFNSQDSLLTYLEKTK